MNKRTKILIWMVISMILGYLPWYNFSAVVKYIAKELNLTAADTGMIISAFQLGYVVIVVFTGWLADKIGTKAIVAWATLLTGIFSTMFAYLTNSLASALILRVLTGAACGAIYAPGMALLSNWFPPAQRGYALGAYTGALVAAYAGSYFVAGPVAASHGWRMGVLATSLPVFIAFLIVWFLVEEKPKEPELQFDGALPAPEGGWAGPIWITASYMGHMWELYAFWGWIGPFMVANALAAGFQPDAAAALGSRLAALIILTGAPAVWLWGMVADKWGRTKAIIVGALCSLIANLFFGFLYGKSLALVVLVGLWIGFWVISDSAIYKAGLVDMTSPKVRTTVLGVQSAVGFSMTIFAPIIFGKVLQYFNGPVPPTEVKIWWPGFTLLGLGALLAPIAALITRSLPQSELMAGGKR